MFNSEDYINRARAAALAGQAYNPQLAFQPVTNVGESKYYETDWSNLGPRLAATWNPPLEKGWLGSIFKHDKSLLRGGYALVFDRTNSVQHIFALGMGYGENLALLAPRCNVSGTPGPGCLPERAPIQLGSYRVGVDGLVPTPPHPVVTAPIVPTVLTVTAYADSKIKTGRTHSYNFSYQRTLPSRMVMEAGWVLRLARELPQAYVLSSVPYFHVDNGSRQTFAQAFDAIATQLRAGTAPAAVTPQPWFENQLAGGQTALIAAAQSTSFIDGNLSQLWLQINQRRIQLGQQPLSNQQIQTLWARGDGGKADYHAFYATLRRRMSSGLTFSGSYTLSKSMDQAGVRQNVVNAPSSAFDLDIDWGPADTDRRHVLNVTGVYDLPFGKNGGGWSILTGGWYVAGIFTATSGIPLNVCQRAGVYGGGLAFTGCVGAVLERRSRSRDRASSRASRARATSPRPATRQSAARGSTCSRIPRRPTTPSGAC